MRPDIWKRQWLACWFVLTDRCLLWPTKGCIGPCVILGHSGEISAKFYVISRLFREMSVGRAHLFFSCQIPIVFLLVRDHKNSAESITNTPSRYFCFQNWTYFYIKNKDFFLRCNTWTDISGEEKFKTGVGVNLRNGNILVPTYIYLYIYFSLQINLKPLLAFSAWFEDARIVSP